MPLGPARSYANSWVKSVGRCSDCPQATEEVWVDGKKIVEQHQVWDKYWWLKASHTFAAGEHHLDVYSAGQDNALQHESLTFTVQ